MKNVLHLVDLEWGDLYFDEGRAEQPINIEGN